MGGSYGHMLVVGATAQTIASAFDKDPAYLIPFQDSVAVFTEFAAADAESAAIELSSRVAATVFAFAVLDDDVLAGGVCRAGETVAQFMVPTLEEYHGIDHDEMELMGEYLGEETPGAGTESDPVGFVLAADSGDPRAARKVLERTGVTATERHAELLDALGLPSAIAGWDFDSIAPDVSGFTGPSPIRLP